MNESDRLFARIAINKSYVLPTQVEEASTYLEKLRSGPGGAMLPLSIGSILAKLGRLSQIQVAAVQKDMEPFGYTCAVCSKRAFHVEHGDVETRCETCREQNAQPKPVADSAKAGNKTATRSAA